MTRLEVFTNRIELIGGVESFVLVRRSGEVVTHNLRNPGELAAMVTICGIGANAVMQSIGFSHFRHLTINRVDRRSFLVFFLDRYFLGVQQVAGADDGRLARDVYDFLQDLLSQNRKEA